MIPPVSVCHQLSWIGSPSASSPQCTASGFSGSPTLATRRKRGQVAAAGVDSHRAHHHADRGRRGVPDGDALAFEGRRTNARASNSASSSTSVAPIVSGAMIPYDVPGDPSGIGGAPEDVVGMQVEREPGGRVVRDDRLVDVHGALRSSRRAAREVQQRELVRDRSDRSRTRPTRRASARRTRRCRRAARARGRAPRRGSTRPCAGTATRSSRAPARRR